MHSSVYLQFVVTIEDDDVLSLSIHEESIDDSSSRATDISDMILVDEVGYGQDYLIAERWKTKECTNSI